MKVSKANSWLLVTLLATGGLWAPGLVRAQDTSRRTDTVTRAEQLIGPPPPTHPQPASPRGSGGAMGFGGRVGTDSASEIRKAAEAIRDAKGDEAKSAAQKKLSELLSKCYDEDMVQRERELKQIEERLTKLRELLDRRRTKKQEIIDLQTKVALNEAEGLGFYDSERPAKGGARSFSVVAPRIETSGSTPDIFFVNPMPALDSAPVVPNPSSR
jgi:hypothetical protein